MERYYGTSFDVAQAERNLMLSRLSRSTDAPVTVEEELSAQNSKALGEVVLRRGVPVIAAGLIISGLTSCTTLETGADKIASSPKEFLGWAKESYNNSTWAWAILTGIISAGSNVLGNLKRLTKAEGRKQMYAGVVNDVFEGFTEGLSTAVLFYTFLLDVPPVQIKIPGITAAVMSGANFIREQYFQMAGKLAGQ
jgi:hypothetical protein